MKTAFNFKSTFITLVIISILGIITSSYLVYNHYALPTPGTGCDFSTTISCSVVNTSVFSELLNVPVALLGVIWFVFLLLMAARGLTKKSIPAVVLLTWSILGIVSVIYLVIAEIILQALCPYCTLVHVLTIITFILSLILFKKSSPGPSWKSILPWLIAAALVTLVPVVLYNLPNNDQNYDQLAQCLTDNGVTMYGSFRCGVCAKTKALFGNSFQYINEVECHPQGPNAQTELCLAKNISGTPTWIIERNGEEIKRYTGFLSPAEVAVFGGCSS